MQGQGKILWINYLKYLFILSFFIILCTTTYFIFELWIYISLLKKKKNRQNVWYSHLIVRAVFPQLSLQRSCKKQLFILIMTSQPYYMKKNVYNVTLRTRSEYKFIYFCSIRNAFVFSFIPHSRCSLFYGLKKEKKHQPVPYHWNIPIEYKKRREFLLFLQHLMIIFTLCRENGLNYQFA